MTKFPFAKRIRRHSVPVDFAFFFLTPISIGPQRLGRSESDARPVP